MSDFDKEAERERLREKYEQDKQKREASERMSDLLLKGATMTNAHCNDCGDPIFRYDGDEFCPTCQRVVTNDEAVEEAAEGDGQVDDPVETPDDASAEAGSSESPTENGDTPDHIEVKQPDGPAVRTGSDQSAADQSAADQPAGGRNAGTDSATDHPEGARAPTERAAGGEQSEPNAGVAPSDPQSDTSGPSHAQRQPANGRTASPAQSGDEAAAPAAAGDDFGAARASLVRTLRNQAELAEETDDPRRARDHLAAAREAAEALGALSGSY